MPPTVVVVLGSFFALLAAIYTGWWQPIFNKLGDGRVIRPVGNFDQCTNIPDVQACGKSVLHSPTGLLYLACSTSESRQHWHPAAAKHNYTALSANDYVAIYNPEFSKTQRLSVSGFTSDRGLSVHGMDVVPSSSDPNTLFVYLVNHRPQIEVEKSLKRGADSAIEVFTTTVGGDTLKHVRTVEDSTINTPNDIVGSSDGKSFYFTNDHGAKTGILRDMEMIGLKRTNIVYCHVETGCKVVQSGMHANYGITASHNNDTLYVANGLAGGVTLFEKQLDGSLVLSDHIDTEYPLDKLSVDDDGQLWAAGLPHALGLSLIHFNNPAFPCPSAALRISINTGTEAFYGEKYKVDRVFENDGNVASGVTAVTYDSKRKNLYLSGIASQSLTVCKL